MLNENLIDPGPFGQELAGAVTETQGSEAAPTSEAAGDVVASAAQENEPKKPIFKGIQREFTDLEELSKYTLELEKQTLEQQARLSGMAGVDKPQASETSRISQGIDYKSLGDEFILNPQGAVEKIINHVRSSVMGDVNQQVGRTEFYKAFYEVNEDLVGCEDLVDISVAQNSEKWKNIPQLQAAKLLAEDVRQRANKIRSLTQGGTTLPNKPAHALPTGSNPAPRAAAPAPTILSFAEQLKKQQVQHKKRA